jgi:hypothetical protein
MSELRPQGRVPAKQVGLYTLMVGFQFPESLDSVHRTSSRAPKRVSFKLSNAC